MKRIDTDSVKVYFDNVDERLTLSGLFFSSKSVVCILRAQFPCVHPFCKFNETSNTLCSFNSVAQN